MKGRMKASAADRVAARKAVGAMRAIFERTSRHSTRRFTFPFTAAKIVPLNVAHIPRRPPFPENKNLRSKTSKREAVIAPNIKALIGEDIRDKQVVPAKAPQ